MNPWVRLAVWWAGAAATMFVVEFLMLAACDQLGMSRWWSISAPFTLACVALNREEQRL